MDLALAGKVVVVTGASSGIGAALAEAYGREGARVALTYHSDGPGAARTAAAVRAAGGEAIVFRFDLSDPSSARSLMQAVVERWRRIDVLVANAVVWPGRSPDPRFEGLARDKWEPGLRSNVEGTFELFQAARPTMRAAGWGRILFISSGLAEEGMAGSEAYAAAKSAIHGLARSLAWDVGRDGIASRVPHRRLSFPSDLAGPVLFLTSAANTSITGEIVREGSSTGRSSHVA